MIAELVETIARGVVRNPDEVEVTESVHPTHVEVAVRVANADFGRIIGRSGQMIDAIRSLASYVGEREGRTVTVDVVERSG